MTAPFADDVRRGFESAAPAWIEFAGVSFDTMIMIAGRTRGTDVIHIIGRKPRGDESAESMFNLGANVVPMMIEWFGSKGFPKW